MKKEVLNFVGLLDASAWTVCTWIDCLNDLRFDACRLRGRSEVYTPFLTPSKNTKTRLRDFTERELDTIAQPWTLLSMKYLDLLVIIAQSLIYCIKKQRSKTRPNFNWVIILAIKYKMYWSRRHKHFYLQANKFIYFISLHKAIIRLLFIFIFGFHFSFCFLAHFFLITDCFVVLLSDFTHFYIFSVFLIFSCS